jgi:hypothetical protein
MTGPTPDLQTIIGFSLPAAGPGTPDLDGRQPHRLRDMASFQLSTTVLTFIPSSSPR